MSSTTATFKAIQIPSETSMFYLFQADQDVKHAYAGRIAYMSEHEYYHWASVDDGWICKACKLFPSGTVHIYLHHLPPLPSPLITCQRL